MIFLQISIGALVAGMDAGKIYNSWPLMGLSYFPDDNNILNLFKLTAFNDPSMIQFIHRNLAYLIAIYYLFMIVKIIKNQLYEFYKPIKVLGIILFTQILLGILTILFGAHIILASMHQISSIFLVSSSIYLLFFNTRIN